MQLLAERVTPKLRQHIEVRATVCARLGGSMLASGSIAKIAFADHYPAAYAARGQ